jgi:putative AlgH/UPF0301 family transcriptional regulator
MNSIKKTIATTSSSNCRRRRFELSMVYGEGEIENDFVPSVITSVPFTGAGCIILAYPKESNRFFSRAAIFIYQYSQEEGAKGVILERESAFSMGETSPGIGCFEANTLYIGGESGSDTAIMLGKVPLDGACKYVGAGIYVGGTKSAKEKIMAGQGVPKDFKFFFNHSEWAPGVLEKEVEAGKWNVVKVPPEDVLLQDTKLAELWSRARNTLISEKKIEPFFDGED